MHAATSESTFHFPVTSLNALEKVNWANSLVLCILLSVTVAHNATTISSALTYFPLRLNWMVTLTGLCLALVHGFVIKKANDMYRVFAFYNLEDTFL